MHALTSHDLTVFLTVVGIMLILARFLFKVGNALHIPTLVAELLAGIILGPTVLGYIYPELHQIWFPDHSDLLSAYDTLFNISVVMLLFLGGLELDFGLLAKNVKPIFIITTLAILVPLCVGIWAGWQFFTFFHGYVFSAAPFVFPLTFGTILAISALPIIFRVLMDNNLLNHPVGLAIIGTAVITDLVGWLLFSSILVYANPTLANIQILYTLFYVILFFVVMIILTSLKKFMGKLFWHTPEDNQDIPYDLSMLFGLCFLCGAFTNAINIHPTLGAFISGIVCRRIIGDNLFLFEQLKLFIMNFFAPLFFISIGLKINFYTELNVPMTLAVFFLACSLKLIGAILGGYLAGFSSRFCTIIGFALNGRGAMEIIMGAVALKIGLIGEQLFVAFVITAVITALMVEPIVAALLKNYPIKERKQS